MYMENKHMKMYSASFVIKEMPTQNTVRCCYTPTRMAHKLPITRCSEDVTKSELLHTANGNGIGITSFGKV